MTYDRARELRELFDRAVDLDPTGRSALVAETRFRDAELGEELATLLDHDASQAALLDRPAISAAARELAREAAVDVPAPEIPGYRIISKLGAGGMGEVYLAEDENLGRRVALKLLPASLTASSESLARFKREARAASALNHPGILIVHDIGSSGGSHYIATELIEGETLRDVVSRGPLSVAEVLRIGESVAEALAAAHDAGIVHRDVKPENVMIRRDGYLKVLDFGLAKVAAPSGDEAPDFSSIATEPGRILGTVAYMSPEQLHGGDVDARSDVWSLGVMLFELLTGKRPFAGVSTAGTIGAILTSETPQLEGGREQVPARLEAVIRKALEKDAGQRFASARELRDELHAIRSDREFDERVRLRSGDSGSGAMPAGSTSATGETATVARGFNRKALAFVATAGLLVVLAAGLVYRYRTTQLSPAESGDAIRSIAVLPFLPVASDQRDESLEFGMADTIVTKLSGLGGLDVRPISAVRAYAQPDRDPLAAGRALGVAAVLEGTLQQSGDRLRVNVRLLRVRDGAVLWSSALDERMSDIFGMQDAIAGRVVAALRLEVSGDEQRRLARRDTQSSEAYQVYLKGRYFLDRRGTEWRRKSVEQFSKAVEIDPAYAPAYAGLSDAYAEMVYWGDERALEYMPKARAAAERAVAIDDTLAEAHTSLGAVLDDFDWKFDEAERQYRRAIELNPKYALAHQRLAQLLAELGRFDEARNEVGKALELDPLSLNGNMTLGSVLYLGRDFDGAAEQLIRTLEMEPQYVEATGLLGWIRVQQGRPEEGVELWTAITPEARVVGLRAALARGGIRAYFARDLDFAFEQQRAGEPLQVFSAMELAYLGRKDEAFAVLERAFEERNGWMGELNVEPGWDPLRSDPRFQDLLRRVGLAS